MSVASSSMRTRLRTLILASLSTVAVCVPLAAQADSLRLGTPYVLFHDHNTDLTQTSGNPANATPAGLNTHVQPLATLLLTYSIDFTDHLSAEIVAGIPPHFRAKGVGPTTVDGVRRYDGETLLTGTAITPTAFLEYKFFKPGDIRPYLGLGVNYTRFVKTKMTDAGALVSGGGTRVDLSSSKGLAYAAGLEMPIARDMSLAFSVSRFKLITDVRTETDGQLIRRSHQDLGPTLYSLTAGYDF